MIHYHGGPITPMPVGLAVWKARHAMVSFAWPDQIKLAAEICQSFALDNGAFSVWQQGGQLDLRGYLDFVSEWALHPGFDWALIPDVIEGSEPENDLLIQQVAAAFPFTEWVPVWHMHESLSRLEGLVNGWRRVALGSSGEYAEPGAERWWTRISQAMELICDEHGRPRAKLHGLRMMDPTIFSHIPFASVDSTMVARNSGMDSAWKGPYQPLSESVRGLVLVDRIESHAAAVRWTNSCGVQKNFELVG